MKSYQPVDQGGFKEGASPYDTYHCWAAAQYREKVCTIFLIVTLRLICSRQMVLSSMRHWQVEIGQPPLLPLLSGLVHGHLLLPLQLRVSGNLGLQLAHSIIVVILHLQHLSAIPQAELLI
jgi:hypothetical protein